MRESLTVLNPKRPASFIHACVWMMEMVRHAPPANLPASLFVQSSSYTHTHA